MRIAYFDCFAGISGDMTLGALLDAGADEERFRGEIGKLSHLGFNLEISKVLKRGVQATDVRVLAGESRHHRRLAEISDLIGGSTLTDSVKERSLEVFRRLAEAEADVHGTTPDRVHFHEIGAVDAVVDIVGAAVGIELLGIERVYASPLPMGRGFVETEHGRIPLPAPATVELLKGLPVYPAEVDGELVTPTGAAIVRTLAVDSGDLPPMRIESVGYGAGKTEFPFPNVLRIIVGASDPTKSGDVTVERVSIVETNIDDMNPELYDSILDKLFKIGALDVYLCPICMKKNRPATLLRAICPIERTDDIASIILSETTSFGVRIFEAGRRCLDRRTETVSTKFGKIRIKVGLLEGKQVTASPEYEDCRKAAEAHGVPVRRVYEEAVARHHASGKVSPAINGQG